MRTRTMSVVLALTLMFGLGARVRAAEEAAAAKKTPSQEEMMAAMMKAATPGPEHAKLKTLEGNWTADVTATDPASGKEEKSTGTMKNQMILGGRYLKQDYSGTMMGMPFKGGGLVGYDNVKKKYTMLWVDEMSTQMMMSEGTFDESAKTLTTMCTMDCPVGETATKKTFKQVVTMSDDDHHTYDMFEVTPDGKENKVLTIKYTRAKG
jgi:hypothetical protein